MGKNTLKYLKNFKYLKIEKIYFHSNKKILTEEKKIKKKLTNNINEIVKSKSIKFVDIVTPIDTHSKLALKFLKNKKKVLVEKPLLMSRKDERKIRKYSKNLTVSYPYLFSKTLACAKKNIKENKIGKIKFIEIFIQQCGRFNKFDVNKILLPHALSIISIFYKINNIKFKLTNIIKENNKAETSLVHCYDKNKLIGIINLSLNYVNSIRKKQVNIFCEKGNIYCDLENSQNNFSMFKYERKKIKNARYEKVKIKKVKILTFDEKNNLNYAIKDFLKKRKNSSNFKLTQIINNLCTAK